MENIKQIVTLKNGSKIQIENETIECPVCLNGRMIIVDDDVKDVIVLECEKCSSRLTVPFIDFEIKEN